MKKDRVFYLLEIGEHKATTRENARTIERALKVGITNNLERRLKEHEYHYQTNDIKTLFVSELLTWQQAVKMEDRNRKRFKDKGWEWIPQDRFEKPKGVEKVILERRSRRILKYEVKIPP